MGQSKKCQNHCFGLTAVSLTPSSGQTVMATTLFRHIFGKPGIWTIFYFHYHFDITFQIAELLTVKAKSVKVTVLI